MTRSTMPRTERPRRRSPQALRRGRRHGERGAAVVELALVAPLIIMLIMGIVDFATLSNQKIGLRGGVREASWNGSRAIFGAPCAAGALVYTTAPTAETQRLMCMVKLRSGLPASEIRVQVRLVKLSDPSLPGTYAAGDAIMVCAMRRASSSTRFFSSIINNKLQKARLTTAIISVSTTNPSAIANASETSIDGNAASWNFCDPMVAAPD